MITQIIFIRQKFICSLSLYPWKFARKSRKLCCESSESTLKKWAHSTLRSSTNHECSSLCMNELYTYTTQLAALIIINLTPPTLLLGIGIFSSTVQRPRPAGWWLVLEVWCLVVVVCELLASTAARYESCCCCQRRDKIDKIITRTKSWPPVK